MPFSSKNLFSQTYRFIIWYIRSTNATTNKKIKCEDFIKFKLLKSSNFTNCIKQLHHKHSLVYANVQFFKAIPTDYKNNCSSFFIFNGYSRQKLQYIYQLVVMPLEVETLWIRYSRMKNHEFVLVNTLQLRYLLNSCLTELNDKG